MISQELIDNIQTAVNTIKQDEYALLIAQSERELGLEPTFKHEDCKHISPIQKEVFGIYTILFLLTIHQDMVPHHLEGSDTTNAILPT